MNKFTKQIFAAPFVRLKLLVVKLVCAALLPRDVCVSKIRGPYTCKYGVVFGELDGRGVLQGKTESDISTKSINAVSTT
jgi:hypothetical protein